MIAPLRETDAQREENARLLARARRAVATALLQETQRQAQRYQIPPWQVVLVTAWAVSTAVSSVGLVVGWWKLNPF